MTEKIVKEVDEPQQRTSNMPRRTRLTYDAKDYFVNDNKVTCVLYSYINVSDIPGIDVLNYWDIFGPLEQKGLLQWDELREIWIAPIKTVGVAKCLESDEFDETLGKKIALTRAQADAFFQAAQLYDKILDTIRSKVFDRLNDLADASIMSGINCMGHVSELIGETPEE